MHAISQRWTFIFSAMVVASAFGCRGSQPFGRFVQVTQQPDSEGPEVEAPKQRLASSKPRVETEVTVTTEEDRLAPRNRRASARKPTADSTSTEQKLQLPSERSQVERSLAERRVAEARIAELKRRKAAAKDRAAAEQIAASQKISEPTSVDLATMENSDLIDAFSDYPPEVQKEALRRLLATTAKSAEKSSHPESPNVALAQSIQDLPELPKTRTSKPGVLAQRLASKQKAREAVRSGEAQKQAIASNASKQTPTNSSMVTDIPSNELEPTVVQTLSDAKAHQNGQVKTVSASADQDEESMIARASLSPENGLDKRLSSKEMDEKTLFANLVGQLSQAPAGESESDRASRLIKLRHLMVLSGNLDSAVQQIDGMSDSEQEFLRHQLLGLWTMVDPAGHPVPSRRITTALPQLREATKFAAAATDSLEVRSLAFCTEIESYGQIKTFSGNRFDAGQQVILYCEIENFTVEKIDDGYQTHLQGSYDVYNEDDEKVVSQLLPADKQVSANYLRDYFIAYQMNLPQQLSPGTYRLQLTMEDVGGKKYGQAMIPFQIAK